MLKSTLCCLCHWSTCVSDVDLPIYAPAYAVAVQHATCGVNHSWHTAARWGRTLQMNKALCREVGGGAFPTPENIVEAGLAKLQASCGLGYRANSILNLAYEVPPCLHRHA